MPSPYQREMFKAINASGSLMVSADYFAASAGDRLWARDALEPYEKVLPGMQFLRGGASGRFNPGILRRLREVSSDLVVVSDYSAPSAQIAMRTLSAAGRRWLFWGEMPGVNVRGPIGLWGRRRLQAPLGHATAIAAIGSRAAATYRAMFPHVPVFDIPYFCDLEPFRRAGKIRPLAPTGCVRLLFSGQLIERKGIDLLMHAFQEALQHAPGLELRILGEGPMRRDLERIAASTQNRVVFLGHRPPSELPDLFAEADMFVLSSRHDGWGVVVNEALGAGLPIVVSDGVGAAHDLVTHGFNGLITPAGDARGLRDALVLLACDSVRRRAMADASRARAAHWGLEEGVRRWKAMCAEIFDGGATVHPAMKGTSR
jgi:glycosyltransferase involved in cell wall biosynthesis